jgi:branched-chain amino acid transport system substrate-binding protein
MLAKFLSRQYSSFLFRVLIVISFIGAVFLNSALPVISQATDTLEIAAALSLTGDSYTFGQGSLEGIQLAIEEANASGIKPQIKLTTYDDKSSETEAKNVANKIANSQAALVLGPAISTISLAEGPIFAQAGIASLTTTATADSITQNSTTFRVIFKNSDQGELLATYLYRVLGKRQASVLVVDSGYGRSLEEGFRRTATKLAINAQYYKFKPNDEVDKIAQKVAAENLNIPVIFLTLDGEGSRLLKTLHKLGVKGPFLGGDAFGDESFSQRLKDEPEEKRQPGYFTDGLYGLSPMILDSANAEILSFAERFRKRFNRDPVWFSVAGYDAARLAIATLRTVITEPGIGGNLKKTRTAVLDYLRSLNSPEKAVPGLLNPFWFDALQGRQQAIRVGQFFKNQFESAPLQIVPVTIPDTAEIASGAVFNLRENRYARLQRVVYTGVFLNDVSYVDPAKSSFRADFYVWLRFAKDAGPGSADPTDLIFPTVVDQSNLNNKLVEQRTMGDGTQYRLWRVQGEFSNVYDLHLFPFDRQTLSLSFYNARAPMEQIVYVLDKRTASQVLQASPQQTGATPSPPSATANSLTIAAPEAFRNLSQWEPLSARSRRENLVTASSLGDPTRLDVESQRELSGFLVAIELQRRTIATLTKSLLPLVLMTFIMYASLHFPDALVKEKVTVAVTAALSGAVLLTSINNQLGSVGYTIAVEYLFYVFFCLSLLCIVAVLTAERLRASERKEAAQRLTFWTRILFLIAVFLSVLATVILYFQR